MQPLTTPKFVFKRLANDWKLLLSIFVGITVAATLIAGAPVYLRTLERQGLNTAIDRSDIMFLDIYAFGRHIPLEKSNLDSSEKILKASIDNNISDIYRSHERYIKTPNYLVGLPGNPLSSGDDRKVSRGYFQYMSNLEDHVTIIEGRLPTKEVLPGELGPVVEAVLGSNSAITFELDVGDTVILTPSIDNPARVTAKIVGVADPTDPFEEYWLGNAFLFFEPEPLNEPPDVGISIDPQEPPIPLFTSRRAMTEGVGAAYPGTLVSSSWFIYVDKESLKGWSLGEARSRLEGMENDLADSFRNSAVFTGITKMVRDFEERSFFSTVPLLLLLGIMVVTVLYYLSMMVSYLVQRRENAVALLRSRGISTMQLARLYAFEGIVLTVIAVILAPFLAMGVVAVAGKLPYFQDITQGCLLPVELRWPPFAAAAGAGLLSVAILVLPAVLGARTGLIIHKLRSSRPPSVPIFQRYYLDIGLLVVGGLIFWELQSRGHIVSGGLFEGVEVNESLLIAPVLFLTVVALLFMRFFPLFVRFVSGESAALLHLMSAATLVTLASAIAVREIRNDNELSWVGPAAMLAIFAFALWATQRAGRFRTRFIGLGVQSALVALFVVLNPPTTSEVAFIPTISLIAIVPAQIAFYLFQSFTQVAPVWVSMGLWHMARNPLQYSWLVLLLVLVTGLGVMATTVGGTLERSQQERVLYDVAADIRVSGVQGKVTRSKERLKQLYGTIPGVTSISLAYRGEGHVGSGMRGSQFSLLAVESQDFPFLSWYRDDFSERPLTGVMRELQSIVRTEPVSIPEGATRIGLWARPAEYYPGVFLHVVLKDSLGVLDTLTLGQLGEGEGEGEWELMSAELPPTLKQPLQLVSIQLFEVGFGPVGTPGSIMLDDVHVTMGDDGEVRVIEDFEGQMRWTALVTSMISSDVIALAKEGSYAGEASGIFTFGKDTDNGVRGFYHSVTGGPVPIVTSSTLAERSGFAVGDTFILQVERRLVPVILADTVNYFPTMDPNRGGFVVADLDSLMTHLNMLARLRPVYPNELFISEAPGAGQAVREVAFSMAGSNDAVHDRISSLESIRVDPLITAGWKAMVLLSIGIILFTAGLGYVTYLLSFARYGRSEMGFLQSVGLSRQQMNRLLSLEHLLIVVIGLGLGTWAGFQMSDLMVSSVAVTETGRRVIPPFILETDWGLMAVIYGALAAIFIAALYKLTRGMRELDLRAISRMEDI